MTSEVVVQVPEMKLVQQFMISAALWAPLVLTSCTVTGQQIARLQQTHDVKRVEIIYQAHSAAGPLLSTTSGRTSDIVQASAEVPEETSPFQNLTWSKAELRIECPHPDGRADMARVTLQLRPVQCGHECQRQSWGERVEERTDLRRSRRAAYRERWTYTSPAERNEDSLLEMDIRKSELDVILAELDAHGFFEDQRRSTDSESQLEVRLNRRWTSKRWEYEPVLDDLTTRISREGRPTVASKPASGSSDAGWFSWLTSPWRSR